MNKRYLSMIAAAAAIILAASCASEQPEVQQQANQVEIRLRAEVSNMLLTRAATDIQGSQFDYVPANGDDPAKVEKINVEIVDAQVAQDGTDNPLSTTPVRVPYLFQTTATTSSDKSMEVATGTTPPYFPNSGNKVNIYAYYPSTVGTTSASTTVLDNTGSVTFSVQADQTTDANYKLSDLMYGVPTGGNPVARPESGAATVELTFAHKMSKIIVNATALAGVSQIQAVRIVGGSRTVNITDEACTIGTTLTDANTPTGTYISMYTGGTTTSSSCAALLPPQTVNGSFIEIETDLGTATYSVASKAFASGISYTYNISITAAQIGFTTDITDWDNESTVNLVNEGSASFAEAPQLGDAYYSDGSWGNNYHADGASVIGVVAWLGDDKDLKCGMLHGLVMAKSDVSSTQAWGAEYTDEDFLTNIGDLSDKISGCQTYDKNGLVNTTNLVTDGHTHNAASAAKNYTPAAPSTGGNTGWFLPSGAQWLAVMGSSGIGGHTGTFVWCATAASSPIIGANINSCLTASGIGGTSLTNGRYWSSSEGSNDGYGALFVCFTTSDDQMYLSGKHFAYWVRPFLAF